MAFKVSETDDDALHSVSASLKIIVIDHELSLKEKTISSLASCTCTTISWTCPLLVAWVNISFIYIPFYKTVLYKIIINENL